MIRTVLLAVLFLSWARAEEPKANPPALFSMQWNTNTTAHGVVVKGRFSLEERARPESVFIVQVEQRDLFGGVGLPPMSGKYVVKEETIEFRPQFPFQAGVRYSATFRPKEGRTVHSVMEIPSRKQEPSTVVSRIYPTAEVLPENLLKFYLYFSAPMSGGHIYDHIRLLDASGRAVELPFLEIDEELWNADMTRLTLFLDPGRIKRGVTPLEEVGPALQEGGRYTLRIDSSWRDASGTPLKESYEKKFRVGTVDREPPDIANWVLHLPKAGTKEPLKVQFSDPMDHALAMRMIGVSGVSGRARLEQNEQLWVFMPDAPWSAGTYRLMVQTTIEDLAGNNVGKPFEVDLFSDVQKRLTREVAERPFEVK